MNTDEYLDDEYLDCEYLDEYLDCVLTSFCIANQNKSYSLLLSLLVAKLSPNPHGNVLRGKVRHRFWWHVGFIFL